MLVATGDWLIDWSASELVLPAMRACRYDLKSSADTTRISKFIIEWWVPHISAQRPTKAPVFSISATCHTFSEWLASGSGRRRA